MNTYMKDDIAKKALERIKSESIVPESKSVTSLRRFGSWVPVALAVFFGAFAIAGVIFVAKYTDFDLVPRFGLGIVLGSLPYFWIFVALFLLGFADYFYGKTPFGYRRRMLVAFGAVLFVAIVIGGMFFRFGGERYFAQDAAQDGPIQHMMYGSPQEVWSHPEQGLLSGTIEDVSTSTLRLIDGAGKEWNVDVTNAFVGGRVTLVAGEVVKLLGSASGTSFVADEVRPWMGGGMMNGSGRSMMGGGYGSGYSGMMR